MKDTIAALRDWRTAAEHEHARAAKNVDEARARVTACELNLATRRARVEELDEAIAVLSACSCTPLVGDRHGRGCDLYDGHAE